VTRFGHTLPRRYPIRYLRYWLTRRLLEDLHDEVGRPISVLEVGVGQGQMLAFLGGPPIEGDRFARPHWIARWDGIDVNVEGSTRDRYSYSEVFEADIERPFGIDEQAYDAILVLHVLEHLLEPEAALCNVGKGLRPGGVIIGGSPTMPAAVAALHEPWLRRKYRNVIEDVHSHRHLSVITPSRIRRFARDHDFETGLMTGTFFCRWSGMRLEDAAWWARANLLWGALVPSLGGELYFSLRLAGPRCGIAAAPPRSAVSSASPWMP